MGESIDHLRTCREDFGIERNQSFEEEKTVTHNSVFAAHRLQCRMAIGKIDIRHFVFAENPIRKAGTDEVVAAVYLPRRSVANAGDRRICNRESAIYNPQSIDGGIAQLVERQLCKLEVRGSNPLASSLCSRRRRERRLSRRSVGGGGHLFGLNPFSRELRLGKP